jgi:CBS domain-containing protein
MAQRIRDVMTTPPVAATGRSVIDAALRLLREERLAALPVVDEHGTLMGCLTRDTVTVHPDDEIATVVELMRSTSTTILPVVDGVRLVGTVTLDDLIAVRPDIVVATASDACHRRLAGASAGTARPED